MERTDETSSIKIYQNKETKEKAIFLKEMYNVAKLKSMSTNKEILLSDAIFKKNWKLVD